MPEFNFSPCRRKMTFGMSLLAERIFDVLTPFIKEQVDELKFLKDKISIQYRRCFGLALFNIVKLDSLHLPALRTFLPKVPACRLPLIDLPSLKLSGNWRYYFN